MEPGPGAGLQIVVRIVIAGGHILIHLGIFRVPVHHADLLALVDKGRSLLEQIHSRQHFAAGFPIIRVAIAGDDPGMVMVFQEEHIPTLAVQLVLPVPEGLFQLFQRELRGEEILEKAVGTHGLVLDHHAELLPLALPDVFQGDLRRDHGGFGQSHAVVVQQHILLEFREKFMDPGAVVIHKNALVHRQQMVIGQALFLGDKGDDILPEAVHPHVQPEAHDLLDLFPDQRVIHIQVRLLHGKQVHIVFLAHLVIGPGLALKVGIPVIGELAVFPGGPPDIVIRIGLNAAAALLEPLVLIAGVIHHQVHDDLHSPAVGSLQNCLEGLHAAELRIDIHIVGDIIAAVCAGGRIQR